MVLVCGGNVSVACGDFASTTCSQRNSREGDNYESDHCDDQHRSSDHCRWPLCNVQHGLGATVTLISEGPTSLRVSRSPRVHVLVVDDDEDQRHLLRIHFENAGCDVTVADSAESAITAFQGKDIHLTVTELLLPGMDGWALSKRIRVDQPECRVAICSVLDTEDYPSACVPLPKPVTQASVWKVLQGHVPQWVSPRPSVCRGKQGDRK